MEKRVINEEQFKKLVISEAKKFLSEDDTNQEETMKRTSKFSFDKVESLINEMEGMNKSIISLTSADEEKEITENVETPLVDNNPNNSWLPNQERDLDPIEHNKKKNVMHVNEGEKDKWKRMLDYKIPKDDER